ncbi:MAG TPA: MSMEG_1061 family FMN-dependent PPOX-type flavoprotein [Chloroflexota bacterium]|nr:MSMEG_1061 family FMN-dependent PPOX-type flavoprotein [Chloroflexota bacterium]
MTPAIEHAICETDLAERFGPPAAEVANKVQPRLTDWMTEFIRRSPFMVMATSTSSGACDVSPKGGGPGFVVVVDDQTLLIPDYKGNNLFFGHRNIFDNPQVALLFLIPGEGWTVRVTGHVQIVDDAESLQTLGAAPHGERPRLGLKVSIDECFSHCPKALVRSDIWNPEKRSRFPKRPDPPDGWLAGLKG